MHNSNGEQNAHQGGNAAFWRDESVMKFDLQQSLVSEKNEDTLANITRITAYFA